MEGSSGTGNRQPATGRYKHTHADGSHSEQSNDEVGLWGIYTRGMDEWVAATSRAAAENDAAVINMALTKRPRRHELFDPNLWAIPDRWPFSPESHARSLTTEAS